MTAKDQILVLSTLYSARKIRPVQKAHENSCSHAHDKGKNRMDAKESGAEPVHAEALDKAGQTKDAAQKGSAAGTQQNCAHHNRNGDKGDGKRADFEIAQRCKGHDQDDGGQSASCTIRETFCRLKLPA